MELKPIAYFKSPFTTKFGIPKQSGLVTGVEGKIVFTAAYSHEEAIRGIEGYDYIWLIWGFSANKHQNYKLTVRPPLLGGNKRKGVFATRSPFRPNPIGLSSVRLIGVEQLPGNKLCLKVIGADLMDNTPIYDIKPYIEYADCHIGVRNDFVDEVEIKRLQVKFAEDIDKKFTTQWLNVLADILSFDPRPRYQEDPDKVYGMCYDGFDVHFRVDEKTLTVTEIVKRPMEKNPGND